MSACSSSRSVSRHSYICREAGINHLYITCKLFSSNTKITLTLFQVESSKRFEMVNIIDDETWSPEPALRPEDEIVLRKLREMLQSTADDLKLLSGELSKTHQPGVRVKTQPTPLDEDFNEKVHIEEIVNAKFHGYKIIDKETTPLVQKAKDVIDGLKNYANNPAKTNNSHRTQLNSTPVVKKPFIHKKLVRSGTKVVEIGENIEDSTKTIKLNNGKVINAKPAVAYNEFSYKYEPKIKETPRSKLQIQDMPKINIRSELKYQKVLHLDIVPNTDNIQQNSKDKSNVAVMSIAHETSTPNKYPKTIQQTEKYEQRQFPKAPTIATTTIQPARKVFKMSTYESSGSTNNISSDTQHMIKTQRQIKSVIRSSPKSSARDRNRKKSNISKQHSEKRTHLNLDEWKRKLNAVYGQPSTSKRSKTPNKTNVKKVSPKISNLPSNKPRAKVMNNTEYIPYSKLTLGGARVSDIEREISDIPNKNDIPLSPIIDKILSSRENSFQNDSPKKFKNDKTPRILNTSDENLLQEVIDIEKIVGKTITKNVMKKVNKIEEEGHNSPFISEESDNKDSYADDFEDDKSDTTNGSKAKVSKSGSEYKRKPSKTSSDENNSNNTESDDSGSKHGGAERLDANTTHSRTHNRTYTKVSNLAFKNSVDVFEYVHSVDTQDTATQSQTSHKISLKETQTSPRNDKPNIQPIHNDLWPSIDPKGDVEKLFKLEKDFIKKMILDEYGDLLEKNLTKPSTSKDSQDDRERNVSASQKNTQTSPAHLKCVMTSPIHTKTRTTSPFLSVTVDRHTSPMVVVTNELELKVEIDNEEDGISINLSSPRFNLRLPQTSREVLSNLENCCQTPSKVDVGDDKSKSKTFRKIVSSSSSMDGDRSSSELSSLGEVRLRRRLGNKQRISSESESSSSSVVSKCSSELSAGILPLKSEGEISLSLKSRNNLHKASKSEGEASVGRSYK